jgi:polysaccharide biosynthesis/export protein
MTNYFSANKGLTLTRTLVAKAFLSVGAALALAILGSTAVCAQSQEGAATPPSDLARQNFERVAATASQIQTVLRKDPGLMVELKRWIAKDATDHGQLVTDADLTDQAIYDRLESDVQFRAVATLLVQKYGYLQPQINPDSPQGKQQELVIKDRAKWLAQDEEQQMTEARQPTRRSPLESRGCDLQQDPNCAMQMQRGSYPSSYPSGEQEQEIGTPVLPQTNYPSNNPNGPGSRSRNVPLLERTQLSQPGMQDGADLGDMDFGEPLPSVFAGMSQAGPGTLVPSSSTENMIDGIFPQARSGRDFGNDKGAASAGSLGAGAEANLRSQGIDNSERMTGIDAASFTGTGPSNTRAYGMGNMAAMQPNSRSSPSLYPYRPRVNPNLSRAMLRQPVPYVDVPSLYDMYLQAAPQPPAPERFGMEVFENGSRDSQLIPFDLPVGPDYVVGPGDSLAVDLWGGVSQRLLRTVDREGRVSLPEVGPVLVAGKSLADVQESVQKTLRSQFRDISADVSLARLRTIRVYVVGDVAHPGAYDISSLSTPLNALFAAGGPTSEGSLRILEHNRGNQLVQDVDVYDLLLHGVRTGIDRLENGDTVLVPPIGPQVTVEGMVRRPSIYELHDEKSLSDVLTLAGGLLPTATLRHVEVQRIVAHDKRTMLSLDVPPDADPASIKKKLDSFQVQDGDKIRVFPIAPYNQDTLYLEGHVIRPGKYSYRPGMRVTDLIGSYKDLLPEPATQYAEIIRLDPPDFRPTVESFNLSEALSHPGSAPILQPLDTVQIFGRYDFENPPTVAVGGDVRVPGTYRTSGQLHLSDAIHMAGGLAPDAEREDAQVFRHLPDGQLKIFSVNLSEALAGNANHNIVLNSRDRILVHRNPADVEPSAVYIKGEVARPGRYPLTTNMTVADLIRAAGGAKQSADMKDADLTHYEWNSQSLITGQHRDVELADALAGTSDANVSLHNGDVLTIRQLPGWNDLGASISVNGEVMHPGSYGIRPGERLSSVLKRAGGFMPDAYPYGAILIRSDVQQLEDKSQTELVERVREQQASLKLAAKTANDPDEKLGDEAAYQQWQNTLDGLLSNPPLGRVTIQVSKDIKSWQGTPRDVAVRAGDKLVIPKRPSYVMVQGQVFNPTAVAFRPGKSAKWYLSQAGGPTNLANKRAIFVVRADGSVIGAHGSSLFLGSALGQSLQPGDMVVVPEKALGGPPVWKALFQSVQVGTSISSAVLLGLKY